MNRLPLSTLAFCAVSLTAYAGDWPQFRGPSSNGVSASSGLPATWDESTNVAWAVDVPGGGWSMPIITGGKVVITTAVPEEQADARSVHRFEVRCYELASGDLLWSRVAAEQVPAVPRHRTNTYASETPLTDGERVFASFGMNGVYAYTLDGEPLWSKDLGVYPMANDWGAASSLAYDGGLLFLQLDNEQESHCVALDAATGEQRWRVERPDEVSTWSTPIVRRTSRRTELVLGGATVRSYDPTTGDELWSMPIGGRSSASPSTIGDTLIVGSENRVRRGGTPGGLFAVKAGASGRIDIGSDDAADHGLLWANPRGAIGMASPLVVGDKIYILPRRSAIVRVHDLATGEQVHRSRLAGGTTFWSSPWTDGERVYLLDDAGATFVLDPAEGYEPIETNRLPGQFWSTPALADGSLVVRSATRLFCVRSTTGG